MTCRPSRRSLCFSLAAALATTACGGATKVDLGTPEAAPAASAPSGAPAEAPPTTTAPAPTKPAVETVLSGQQLPSRLAVGDGRIFFSVGDGSHEVYRFDISGKEISQLGLFEAHSGIVADPAGFFVWRESDIKGGALDGCTLECDGFIPQFRAEASGTVTALATDASHVYWVTETTGSTVWSYALHRATRTLTARYEAAQPSTFETIATWKDRRVTHLHVHADAGIYAGGDRDLFKVNPNNGEIDNVTYEGPLGPFAADLNYVYWVDARGVQRRKRIGGTRETLLALEEHKASYSFAGFGRAGVYFFSSNPSALEPNGRLTRVDVETRVATELASDIAGTPSGALDGGYFYWSNPSAGTILRVRDE